MGCATRQNCRSGRDDECQPYVDRDGDHHAQACYADTACDSMNGGGKSYIWLTDYALGTTNTTTTTTTTTTAAPTPSPALLFSNDPADHKYCGFTWADANARCSVNCRTRLECGIIGQVCFDTTACDARSPSPSVSGSPTNAPTIPVMLPTTNYSSSATNDDDDDEGPSTTAQQQQQLTEVQLGFFCGTSWEDVTSACRRRCPSGQDEECPGDDEGCFAYTGCPEPLGYGTDEAGWLPGYDRWGDPLGGANNNSVGGGSSSSSSSGVGHDQDTDGMEVCNNITISITADNWPKETSWDVQTMDGTQIYCLAAVDRPDMCSASLEEESSSSTSTSTSTTTTATTPIQPIKGQTVTYTYCKTQPGCYIFTIYDDGGDGLCCDHGAGKYEFSYNGEVLKTGSTFFDSEEFTFGCEDDNISSSTTTTEEVEQDDDDDDDDNTNAIEEEKSTNNESDDNVNKLSRPTKVEDEEEEEETSSAANDETIANEEEVEEEMKLLGEIEKTNDDDDDDDDDDEKEISSNSPSYVCVMKDLVEQGYEVSTENCNKYVVNCYNQYIDMGDDWFCTESEVCIRASACDSTDDEILKDEDEDVDGDLVVIDDSNVKKEEIIASSTELRPARPTVIEEESESDLETVSPSAQPTAGITSLAPTKSSLVPTSEPTSVLTTNFPSNASWVTIDTSDHQVVEEVDEEMSEGKDKPIGKGKPIGKNKIVMSKEDEHIETPAPSPFMSEEITHIEFIMSIATLIPTSSSMSDETEVINELSCTGEPCEDESWCRSRYGSCGPGFIYCNTNAIWKSSCPKVTYTVKDFYCGTNWEDAVTSCNRPCPSGEDPECPSEQTCFADTGCIASIEYDAFGNIIQKEDTNLEEEASDLSGSTGSSDPQETPSPSPLLRDSGNEDSSSIVQYSTINDGSNVPSITFVTGPDVPTLPTLPMPTLPVIIDTASHVMTNLTVLSSAVHSGTTNTSTIDEEDNVFVDGTSYTATDQSTYTKESLEEWLEFATTVKSDGNTLQFVRTYRMTGGGIILLLPIILFTSSII